jgi:hypothetical protein
LSFGDRLMLLGCLTKLELPNRKRGLKPLFLMLID